MVPPVMVAGVVTTTPMLPVPAIHVVVAVVVTSVVPCVAAPAEPSSRQRVRLSDRAFAAAQVHRRGGQNDGSHHDGEYNTRKRPASTG